MELKMRDLIELCPICNSDKLEIFSYPAINLKKTSIRFTEIASCQACGFGIATPRVSQGQLDAFYVSGEYWKNIASQNPYQKAHEFNQSGIRVRKCINYLPRSGYIHVLDVGAGHGFIATWLELLLKEKIHYYHYVEPDNGNDEFIKGNLTSFRKHRIENLDSVSEQYHFILLNHVLEHVADPIDLLIKIKNILKPGGVLYIETPHADYRFKKNVFPHTLFFKPETYSSMAGKLNMKILECESFGLVPSIYTVRIASQFFKICVRFGNRKMQKIIDDWLWQYDYIGKKGMWIRCIFTV
jgi:SAM-dependent methyltransferase